MSKIIDWLNDKIAKLIEGIEYLTVRYLTISTINTNPKRAAESYFETYKHDIEELNRIVGLIAKQQEHLGYYNYTVFMRRIAELTK